MYRVGVKPGKAASALGLAVGILFVLLGVTVIIPLFGPFGLVWTAMAGAIGLYYAYNLFSPRGAAAYQIDVDAPGTAEDFDARLRKLAQLKADGLLSESEYEQKRAEILRQPW